MAKTDDAKIVALLDGQPISKAKAIDWLVAEANRAAAKLANASANRRGAQHAARRDACIEVGVAVKSDKLPTDPMVDLRNMTAEVFNRIYTPGGGEPYDAAAVLAGLVADADPVQA